MVYPDDVSKKSQSNLKKLSDIFGIKFEDKALVWMDKSSRRNVKAWRLLGVMDNKPVEFWRRDKPSGIGDTYLFINGVLFQISWLLVLPDNFPKRKLERFKIEIGDKLYKRWENHWEDIQIIGKKNR